MAQYYLNVDGTRYPASFDTGREADLEREALKERNPHSVIQIVFSSVTLPLEAPLPEGGSA